MRASLENWQPGLHYSVLAPRAKTDVAPGKIEVLELFMYTSPKSREFQPYLAKWLETKPDYIEYMRKPSIVFPHARYQARTYYTITALGRQDLHPKLFDWIAEPDHYPIYHTVMRPDTEGIFELDVAFAKANDIDEVRFAEVYRSQAVTDAVLQAEMSMHSYHVQGTSTVVVNGRYSTSLVRIVPDLNTTAEDFRRWLGLIEHLAAVEAGK